MKNITVLGATGSIGLSTLEIVRQFPDRFKVEALSCKSSIGRLVEQMKEFQPKSVAVSTGEQAHELGEQFPHTEIVWGEEGLRKIATTETVDLVVAGIIGAAGMRPTYAAVEAGKIIAVANKEPLVMAGELFIKTAQKTGAMLLPTDSEHNAIFQALHNEPIDQVDRLILTASGGPFRDRELSSFQGITLQEALAHPNWEMGPKITIDSATMMNKGLEVIEAQWLFGAPVEKIDVVMHPESIIHSMVEFIDGSFLAQMGLPDMKVPIGYCLGWPERLPMKIKHMEPLSLKGLHFRSIDSERFPCFPLAVQVAKKGGAAPAVLNGANEEVVAAFLNEEIRFVDIPKILNSVIQKLDSLSADENFPAFLKQIKQLEDAELADQWGRKQAQEFL